MRRIAALLAGLFAKEAQEVAAGNATIEPLVMSGEPLVMSGIVSETGAGGVTMHGEQGSRLTFQLVAWRMGDGPISTDEVRIEYPGLPIAEVHRMMDIIPASKGIRLEIAALPQLGDHWLEARMVRFLGSSNDLELHQAAEPILHPPPYDHPVLGRFDASPDSRDLFEREIKWIGRKVVLSLVRSKDVSLDILAAAAIVLLENQQVWHDRLQRAVIENYYEVWEDGWRDDDGPLLPRNEWFSSMRIEAVSIQSAGDFTFWLDDGNLFHGHSIEASGTLEFGFDDVKLFG